MSSEALSPENTAVRSTSWRLRSRVLEFGELPALMGIVNVTPDSFSDGGHFFSPTAAIEHALRLEDEGADLLDIGGESTRPYSRSVAEETELSRVLPVIEAIASRVAIPISIDTTKSRVAQAAVDLGAEIINDISGFEFDADMLAVARRTQTGVCAMHIQGTPQTMQDQPTYIDVVSEIGDYLATRAQRLIEAGISPERICLDPGIGFGKTHQHNIELVRAARKFVALGYPLMVGHSRKGFVGKLVKDNASRLAGTLGVSLALARAGTQVLRVHDVRATRDAITTFHASGGLT